MNFQDHLPEESDTSDEDYDPGIKEDEVSEVDSDADVEEYLSDSKGPKCSSKKVGKRKSILQKDSSKSFNEIKEKSLQVKLKTDETKKEDDLWADFMKDTGFVSKNSSKQMSNSPTKKPSKICNNKATSSIKPTQKHIDKVKIKQVFEFAGEEVVVEKEVPPEDAALLSNDSNGVKLNRAKRSAGIGNVLSQLTKKSKITTLEKTKLDWDRFKKDENIEEELSIHNKGKDG